MSIAIIDTSEDTIPRLMTGLYGVMKEADKKFKRSATGSLFAFTIYPDAKERLKQYCKKIDQWMSSIDFEALTEEMKTMSENCNHLAICIGPEHYHSGVDDYKYRIMSADDVLVDDPCASQRPDKTVTGMKINNNKYVDVPAYVMKEATAAMYSFQYIYKHTDIFSDDEYHEALNRYINFISHIIDHSNNYCDELINGDIIIMAGFKLAYIRDENTNILEHWEHDEE